MAGNKTHQQQRQILEKRIDTSNAGPDFDPRPDLQRAKDGRPPDPAPPTPRAAPDDGDPVPRGEHQESHQHKNPGRPEE